ncbi:hypothetical protein BVI2075_40043 [Burkholderia vietnamiensis]|nr:hypothetical protein BVI2075_40043 [Burkholderia vietnamiensis]
MATIARPSRFLPLASPAHHAHRLASSHTHFATRYPPFAPPTPPANPFPSPQNTLDSAQHLCNAGH